jgi:hypothetical protein
LRLAAELKIGPTPDIAAAPMGQIVSCSATFKRQTSTGRAELETDYVLFRGDFRVKLPFAFVTAASARDGVLTLKSTEGVLTLVIGAKAEKWAAAITSPKSRIDKIGVKPGQRVSVLGVSDRSFGDELKAAGADVSERVRKDSDAILVAVESSADLRRIASLAKSLTPAGALWAIRRKGVADASEALTMAAGKAAGLVDVKVVRFSDTHTAEKFVRPRSSR